jgi:hypothetical protein
MRIAGGVIMLLVGIWAFIGGACSTLLGGATTAATSKIEKTMTKEEKAKLAKADKTGEGAKAYATVKAAGTGLLINGIASLIGGLLCFIAGIMYFLNKGKILGFIGAGIGIVGEVAFLVMIGMGILTIVKIVLYAFGGIAATKVGEPT